MRVKQTAKKITSTGDEINDDLQMDNENCNNHSSDNANDLSDNEVEFVVECRRDTEGNQFLLDGTLVIEPAPVAEFPNHTELNAKQSKIEEIGFAQFVKEMQLPMNDKTVNNTGVNQTNNKKSQIIFPYINQQIIVKCTACNSKLNPLVVNSIFKHPVLEVVLCNDCIENQKDKYFVIDEEDNKETLCRWCVEGGSLICCDFCSKSYCKTCIKRNLGRTVLSEILNQDDSVQWKCFSCDPTPIKILQDACNKIFNDINQITENRQKLKSTKKSIPRIESVNKKRSISKAFPMDSNLLTDVSNPKIINPSKTANTNHTNNPNVNTINLLNNMEGFGTDWYLRNVKLENILIGIDKVDSRSLLNAINSTKKCVEAFYSDIRNLENEISKASSSTDISAIVSMFKSVYRHHIFNRFCQVQSRIEEDRNSRFVPQTVNGGSNIELTPAGPNLLINSVVSKAPPHKRNNNTFTPSLIAKGMRQISNGERKSVPIMYSIDLTDDAEKAETKISLKKLKIETQNNNNNNNKDVNGEINSNSKEIVDLCNDDDSSSISYPVVQMNFNNSLFAENISEYCSN